MRLKPFGAVFFITVFLIGWCCTFAKSYVYVSLKSDHEIAIYSENETTGILDIVATKTVDGGPASIAVAPDKSRLYVALRSHKKIACYSIAPATGALTFESTIDAIDNPVYIALDKTGKYLFSAYYGASKMAIYAVNNDGSLNKTAVQVEATPDNPHAIQVADNNQFLYVTCMGGDRIVSYYFDEKTGLASKMPVPELVTEKGTGPRHFVFDPISYHLFVVNEVASSVTNYAISKSGYLDAVATISTLPDGFTVTNKCADIHITPNGKFLYATNRGAETIAAFSIADDSNRTMALIGYYDTEKTPREMAIDASGKFLFAAGESSGKLQSYSINQATGELTPLQNIPLGDGPAWVEVVKVDGETTIMQHSKENNRLQAVPNPFKTGTTIKVVNGNGASMGIYNVRGELVYELSNVSAEGENMVYRWQGEVQDGKAPFGQYFAVLKSQASTEVVSLLYQP